VRLEQGAPAALLLLPLNIGRQRWQALVADCRPAAGKSVFCAHVQGWPIEVLVQLKRQRLISAGYKTCRLRTHLMTLQA